jgi:hypothetical protein
MPDRYFPWRIAFIILSLAAFTLALLAGFMRDWHRCLFISLAWFATPAGTLISVLAGFGCWMAAQYVPRD